PDADDTLSATPLAVAAVHHHEDARPLVIEPHEPHVHALERAMDRRDCPLLAAVGNDLPSQVPFGREPIEEADRVIVRNFSPRAIRGLRGVAPSGGNPDGPRRDPGPRTAQ